MTTTLWSNFPFDGEVILSTNHKLGWNGTDHQKNHNFTNEVDSMEGLFSGTLIGYSPLPVFFIFPMVNHAVDWTSITIEMDNLKINPRRKFVRFIGFKFVFSSWRVLRERLFDTPWILSCMKVHHTGCTSWWWEDAPSKYSFIFHTSRDKFPHSKINYHTPYQV